MENIRIIGTSHVAKQSLSEVRKAILDEKPDILALELDQGRLQALLSKGKTNSTPPISKVGLKGYLFFLIGSWLQRRIGKALGVVPGSEMKLAIKMAKEHRMKIALIDRDIRLTLGRLSQSIGWREKLHFFVDFIKAFVFRNSEAKRLGIDRIDISKVPDEELVETLITQIRERYPGTYNSLIEERNQIMARNILKIRLHEPDKKILVIVGAGHKRALEEELERLDTSELAMAS